MDITVREHNRYGGGSVIVWGSMSLTTLTPLQVVDGNLKKVRYREEVLAPIALPTLEELGLGAIFQDDKSQRTCSPSTCYERLPGGSSSRQARLISSL